MQPGTHFRKIWEQLLPAKWVLGLFLVLLLGIPRFIMVLGSYRSGQSQWVSTIFVLMAFTPLIFLTTSGRREMGMRKSTRPWWLVWGFLLGSGMCLLLFSATRLLFGLDPSNPFVYIGSLADTGNPSGFYFLIYMVVVMTFSPIGEELFYRGVVHLSFRERFGERMASVIDSAAFALTHLAHFGIIYVAGRWEFLPLPSLLWVSCMFLTCLVFNQVRRESGSIAGAILTHAGFNFAMGFLIFYAL
jgi:membrane protease YdiL (CAAX protease family)